MQISNNILSDSNVKFLWQKKHSKRKTKSNALSGETSTCEKTRLKIEKNGIGGAIMSSAMSVSAFVSGLTLLLKAKKTKHELRRWHTGDGLQMMMRGWWCADNGLWMMICRQWHADDGTGVMTCRWLTPSLTDLSSASEWWLTKCFPRAYLLSFLSYAKRLTLSDSAFPSCFNTSAFPLALIASS